MRSRLLVLAVLLTACGTKSDPSQPEYWVDQLGNKSTRSKALDKLAEMGDAKAIDALLTVFKEEKGPDRGKAAYALGRAGDARVVDDLVAAIDFGADAKDTQRNNEKIVRALGDLKATKATPTLMKLVNDKDQYVRLAAVSALGQIGDKSAVPKLVDVADRDDNMFMKKNAVMALGDIGDPAAVPALLRAMFVEKGASIYPQASFALFQVGQPAIAPLLEALQGKNTDVEAMEKQYGIMDGAVEAKCIEVLGDLGAKEAEPLMIDHLKRSMVQIEALPGAALIAHRAIFALGRMGGPAAAKALEAFASHLDSTLREVVSDSLQMIGQPTSVAALLAGAKTGDADARRVSLRALGRLGGANELEPAKALVAAEADATVKAVLEPELVRLQAAAECKESVECWTGKLKDPSPNVRDKAAYTLGHLRAAAASDALVAAASDNDLQVRVAVYWALGRVGGNKGKDQLLKVLDDDRGKTEFVRVDEDLRRVVVQMGRSN